MGQTEHQLKLLHPRNRLMEYVRQTGEWQEKLKRGFLEKMKDSRHRLMIYSTRLEGLSPLARLSGGYVYATAPDGSPLVSTSQVQPEDLVTLRLKDGSVIARTEDIRREAMGEEKDS